MDNKITWLKLPIFELINDGEYKNFLCNRYGMVKLGDEIIYFPTGWKTDITSTPRIFLSLVPQIGNHSPAAILHDRLLELKPRKVARHWMVTQLNSMQNVPRIVKFLMWFGVCCKDFKILVFDVINRNKHRWLLIL